MSYVPATRRGLILHDVLAFLALLATSIVLFGVTLFLFKSFQQHRVDLGARWAQRGRLALEQGHPGEAVYALRTALSFTPDERADQLLLAQALADGGHEEEANSYFLNLWDASPGDGFINLQLARLARRRNDIHEADNHYRASIYGSWEDDGALRRREVRLEFTDFLIEQHQNAEARNELFTVAGNAPGNVDLSLTVAEKLAAAGYLPDALSFDEKAVAADPHNQLALERAGRAAYALGDYDRAEHMLERTLEAPGSIGEDRHELTSLLESARRIQQLTLTRDQPAHQRALHIAAAEPIAEARLRSCIAQSEPRPALTGVLARWSALQAGPVGRRRALLEDAADQDTWTTLIYQTEQAAAEACGNPSGDDALLLQLANSAEKGQANNGK